METYDIEIPVCASVGCTRDGYIKSEEWGMRLCATHAVSGPTCAHGIPLVSKPGGHSNYCDRCWKESNS